MWPGVIRAVGPLSWLLFLFLPLAVMGQEAHRLYTVRVPWEPSGPYSGYYITLLKKALEESKEPGETILLEQVKANYSQARWIYETQFQHETQAPLVIWVATNREREAVLRPIRIPILKGTLGKRVFLIRQGEQSRFDRVESLEDLAQLRAGQERHWPDTDILRANGLPVTTSNNIKHLYQMLLGRRFDYFPRGFTEAWHELSAPRGFTEDQDELAEQVVEGLTVEQGLLLSYPLVFYYFVSESHTDLARRIEQGLEALIADGRFDQYFFNHPRNRKALHQLNARPRRVLHLDNPFLPTETPLEAGHLWYQLPFEAQSESSE